MPITDHDFDTVLASIDAARMKVLQMRARTLRQLGGTTLGERIRSAREAIELSQADLARTLGLTRAAVSLWEIGTSTPSVDNLTRIADALGVSIDWLVGVSH